MEENRKPLIYLGGGIMTRGENLARAEEYEKFSAAGLDVDVYSPILNASINNKAAMTEEENNCLAEKIVEADIDRLWNSDYTVMCPEQSAIGTMCEIGVLYGWRYMAKQIIDYLAQQRANTYNSRDKEFWDKTPEERREIWLNKQQEMLLNIEKMVTDIFNKKNYAHYFDIRTNHLNEKDWRRSFSINQMLYGMLLYATADNTLHNSFDEIIPILKEQYNG